MISRLHAPTRRVGIHGMGRLIVASAAAVVLLAGCGAKKEKAASQTAAKVNKEEITIHQINFVLQQQRGLAPEQAASAGKQVLERLIDQELTLQKAQDQKLDRDPRVVQQVEAARREIVSRAYIEKIASSVAKPSAEEVKAYYDAHPALFKDRRVYTLQEVAIQAAPEQMPALQGKAASAKDAPDFVNFLKTNDYKYATNQAVRAAEQLPLTVVDRFSQLKEGQNIFNLGPRGAQVIFVTAIRSQPVDEAKAASAIEQFLANERKRKMVEEDLKALRSAAKIDYVGDYAKGAAEAPAAPAASEPAINPIVLAPAGPTASAAPQIDVEPINTAPAASAPSVGTLDKGMKGLK